MSKHLAILAAGALLASTSFTLADSGGTAAGAVTGGVAGAVVGGPVGAAVGAGVGAAAGNAASGPDKNVVIEHRDVPATGSVGCSTTTTQKTNEVGDTTTKQRTDC